MSIQSLTVDPQTCHQQSIYSHVAGSGAVTDDWDMTNARELITPSAQCSSLLIHQIAGTCAKSTATFSVNAVTSTGENMITSSNEYITI